MMRLIVDPEDGAWEVARLWTAPNADALHEVLALYPPVRRSADAFEPFALLSKHHKTEPATSVVTATLLLTDQRWRGGAGQLVRRIAESGILSEDELDLLAQAFLSAGDAVYWHVPDEWFGDDAIEIEIGPGPQQGAANAATDPDESTPQLAVARREVFHPLRRWAAARALSRAPDSWAALRARAKELGARPGAAVMCGVLDVVDVLPPPAQALLIGDGTTWSDQAVRRLALGRLAERNGPAAAFVIAQRDPNERVRRWAAALLEDDSSDGESPTTSRRGTSQHPLTLF
jgi:hypothetical protein